eukprot:s80_g9.t1
MRSAFTRQAVLSGEWSAGHLPGERMVADIGTKALTAQRMEVLKHLLGMSVLLEKEEEDEKEREDQKKEKVKQNASGSVNVTQAALAVRLITLAAMISVGKSQGEEEENQMTEFNRMMVRGLRLLRLARVLRMVHRFKVVWRLVSGLLSAWDTMVSTTGLIMIWLYIFGCVALEFITTDAELLADSATASIVKENFGSLPKATLTLLQFVTMDAIANVYYPLVMAKPVLIIYFLPLLMFLSIGLMNLVTAVLVEHALQHASQEAEHARLNQKQRIKETLPDLLQVFQGLDADGSGALTRQELADVPISVLPPNVLENVSVDSMEDLFEMLDVDGGGTLTQDEFLEGLLSLLLLDVPMWAIQLQKQMLQLYKLVTCPTIP